MTTRFKGGDTVKRGFYGSLKRWNIELVEKDGTALAGDGEERYVKLPIPVMLVAAPVMGAGFVMFLPLIGFALLGAFAYKKITGRQLKALDEKADQYRRSA